MNGGEDGHESEEDGGGGGGGGIRLDLNLLSDPRDAKVLYNATQTAHFLLDQCRQRRHHSRCKPSSSFPAHYSSSSGAWGMQVEAMPGLAFQYGRPWDYFSSYLAMFGQLYFHMSGSCAMQVPIPPPAAPAAAAVNLEGEEEGLHHPEVVGGSNSNLSRAASAAQQQQQTIGVVDEKLRVLGVSGLRVADASVMPHIPSGPLAAVCMGIGAAAFEFLTTADTSSSIDNSGALVEDKRIGEQQQKT